MVAYAEFGTVTDRGKAGWIRNLVSLAVLDRGGLDFSSRKTRSIRVTYKSPTCKDGKMNRLR